MSTYNEVSISIEDQECLVKALQEMGYKPQVHQEAKALYGYQGDARKQKAHIILPRSQVGPASNDIGFEKVNGKYILRISEYDISAKKFNTNLCKQLYATHRIKKAIKSNSKYKLKEETKEKGKIRVRIQLSN